MNKKNIIMFFFNLMNLINVSLFLIIFIIANYYGVLFMGLPLLLLSLFEFILNIVFLKSGNIIFLKKILIVKKSFFQISILSLAAISMLLIFLEKNEIKFIPSEPVSYLGRFGISLFWLTNIMNFIYWVTYSKESNNYLISVENANNLNSFNRKMFIFVIIYYMLILFIISIWFIKRIMKLVKRS